MTYGIHIARQLTDEQVREGLSHALGIAREQLAVVHGLEQISFSPDLLTCVIWERPGDFPISLEILAGQEIEQILSEQEAASRIAQYFQTDCLISDDSINPFSWLLVSVDGKVVPVFVDPEALDREEFRITRRQDG